ncbi:hypothetical protein [Nocardia sp. NBC_00416]|uniref:hypothetical protein n=1 Tax=Nocardia sp. NBC_00416 TaxID=2975991 RepID=UPI002E245E54
MSLELILFVACAQGPTVLALAVAVLHPDAARRTDALRALRTLRTTGWGRR